MSSPSTKSDQTNLQECPPGSGLVKVVLSELNVQRKLAIPLIAMNLAWFAKTAVTTAFLGHLGELNLAGAALGFTFANVTGFSVMNGLSGAMEPICGQAYGARNFKLLHKTLLMTILLLLVLTLPISFLWLNIDQIFIYFGQQKDISIVAKTYAKYLIPDLIVTSFLCPLKSYLSSQSITVPTMISSALALALHIPLNIILTKTMGLRGVAMAVWITDLIFAILLAIYVLILENRKESRWMEGGWWDQSINGWITLLKLSGSCCFFTCLEWWCYEILVLLTGHLPDAKQAVGVLTIVLNFDYLLFSVMLSLATCVSTRVSNELGANRAVHAYQSACVSLAGGVVLGCVGSLVMVGARGIWGPLFSNDKGIKRGVKKTMMLMALVEVFNFPLAVCGGIVRGTARPWLGMYANMGGFYLFALPLGVVFAFKLHLGLTGLFFGLVIGIFSCLMIILVFIARINWEKEACKAQTLTSSTQDQQVFDENERTETLENVKSATNRSSV